MAQWNDRRVLVTGAAGFIGSRVVKLAARLGAQVTALIRPHSTPHRLMPFSEVVRREADVQDPESLKRAWEDVRPHVVVHAAGRADWRRDPSLTLAMMTIHVMGTAAVLEACRALGVEKVVLMGSAGEYGAAPAPYSEKGPTLPLDPYSVSKLSASELGLTYHRAFGLAVAIVRPFVVYGPGEPSHRLFPSLFGAARSPNATQAFTDGRQLRDFVYVDDVAEGVLRTALASATSGRIINLGTGIGTSVRDAVGLANQVSGNRVQPQFGALPGRVGEPPVVVADIEQCRSVLSWSPPTALESGLAMMWTDLNSSWHSRTI